MVTVPLPGVSMVSPYVRRQRLAAELRKLREERGMMADELAKRIHYSRMKISRLENAHGRPDVADVITILNTLEIPDQKWKEIVTLAHAAATKGWWDRYGDAMGARQRLYADVESGAATIREYNNTTIPGLLQTAEYSSALVKLKRAEGALGFSPSKMTEARERRQAVILDPEGPVYDLILDEVVLRRISVPIEIMAAQLHLLITRVTSQPQTNVRVLPVDAYMEGVAVPRSAFSLYTFPDPADPPMVIVDAPSHDLAYTEPDDVDQHVKRYELLSEAVLSSEDSLKCLAEAADRLSRRATGAGG
ncbi:helix-turn-helix domain-containing protein [Actinomadura formosensis]|uniref:helix-turn-helix domain-containing protein n=1 Tax=Actinomadura formosensis TaxID=60706 RepID=UPI003D8FDF40